MQVWGGQQAGSCRATRCLLLTLVTPLQHHSPLLVSDQTVFLLSQAVHAGQDTAVKASPPASLFLCLLPLNAGCTCSAARAGQDSVIVPHLHHYSALLTLFPHRLYVPRVLDSDANMHFLHLDGWAALEAVPPFGIREPRPTYDDGTPRQDVLLVRLRACVLNSGLGMVWVHCGWGKEQERSTVVCCWVAPGRAAGE